MNWANDLLRNANHKLPFDIPKETTEKIYAYYERWKEKTNEVKRNLDEHLKTLQSPLMEAKPSSEPPLVRKNEGMEAKETVRNAEERSRKAPVPTAKGKAAAERSKNILLKYKITLKQAEGELVLPQNSTDMDKKEAILKHSGYRVTTTILEADDQSTTALAGFNSYASLFSKGSTRAWLSSTAQRTRD